MEIIRSLSRKTNIMDIEMNIQLDEEDTDVFSPSDNYYKLLKTIEELENNIRITEDWYEEHKKLIFNMIFKSYKLRINLH